MALGSKLKNARLDRGLTASEVAAVTRMKVQMIEDIEREDFSKVAATIYGKGFIRLYAEQVGLDPAPLIEEYLTRFVAPENGGKRPGDKQEEPEDDELMEEDDGVNVFSWITSFFTKSSGSEEEAAPEEQAPASPRDARPIRTDKPQPEAEKSFPREPIEAEPEQVMPKQRVSRERVIPKSDPELDLFNYTETTAYSAEVINPTLTPPPALEPEKPIAAPVSKPLAAEPAEAEEEEDIETGPSMADILGDRFSEYKDICIDISKNMWRRLQQIADEQILDLNIYLKKLKDRLPDIKSLELSFNSIPVMIAVMIIIGLLILGLSSFVRHSKIEVTDPKPAIEQPQELRVVINPPEPYYK